ncbi:MAG: Rieske (2Fe-2S) protein [Polyangiales bacterium]
MTRTSTVPGTVHSNPDHSVNLVPRRRALIVLSGVGVAPLLGCGASADGTSPGFANAQDPDLQSAPSITDDSGATAPTDAGTTSHPDDASSISADTGVRSADTGTLPPPTDSGPTTCTPSGTSVGATSSFPVNSWTGVSSINVIVGHDGGGLFAYTAKCTHAGCSIVNDIDPSTGDATCHCHSWQFDGTGACLGYPSRPLVHYAVTSCDGQLYVNTKSTVAASTRTAP